MERCYVVITMTGQVFFGTLEEAKAFAADMHAKKKQANVYEAISRSEYEAEKIPPRKRKKSSIIQLTP